MSWSITPVIKAVVRGTQMGEWHADEQRWRGRRRAAADTLTSQHGACRPASPGKGFLHYCPLYMFFHFLSFCMVTAPPASSFSPHLRYFLPVELLLSFAAARSLFILLYQTDGSWLLQWRKFSHVFLIKAPHRSPVVAFRAESERLAACETWQRWQWGARPSDRRLNDVLSWFSFHFMLPYFEYVSRRTGDTKCTSISVTDNTGRALPGLVIEQLQIYMCRFTDKAFLCLSLTSVSLHLQEETHPQRFYTDQ